MKHVLENCREDDVEKIQIFLDTGINLRDLSDTQPTLLEACLISLVEYRDNIFWPDDDTFNVFEFLLDQGATISPGATLALLIYAGGGAEIVQKLMKANADVNGFFESQDSGSPTGLRSFTPLQAACGLGYWEFARDLLKKGAEVNAPARGERGMTALQEACAWEPWHEAEEGMKKLIRLLIDHGADVNAQPVPDQGMTALQIVAVRGDLDTAVLLLGHKASINAPPGKDGYCALDGAAAEGRLDMVKILLNAHAVSYHRGSAGYDGAISLAEERGI